MFVVVNKFSRMIHFIPCHKFDDTSHITNLFFNKVLRLPELFKSIVSNRYSKFLSSFWRTLWEKFIIKSIFSTTWYPQINDKTKVVNRTLSQLLRYMIFENPRYNRGVNTTTFHSHFEVIYDFFSIKTS